MAACAAEECVVCLLGVEADPEASTTPWRCARCRAVAHRACIERWFAQPLAKGQCPGCRATAVAPRAGKARASFAAPAWRARAWPSDLAGRACAALLCVLGALWTIMGALLVARAHALGDAHFALVATMYLGSALGAFALAVRCARRAPASAAAPEPPPPRAG